MRPTRPTLGGGDRRLKIGRRTCSLAPEGDGYVGAVTDDGGSDGGAGGV